MKKRITALILAAGIFFSCAYAGAYTIPPRNYGISYFYVFGPKGNPSLGAESNEVEFYFDVPDNDVSDFTISVFDPNTGGMRDWRTNSDNPWDTVTEFSVYGKNLLDSAEFGKIGYDRENYTFGPYKKEEGIKTGNFYRFKLVAKGIEGDDQNLFKINISPESTASFAYKINFRLTAHEGDKMYFFPKVPAGTSSIIIENYDVDKEGATSVLYDMESNQTKKVKDSKSGEWTQTVIELPKYDKDVRLKYEMTKLTQHYGNAALRFKDSSNNPIPVFFKIRQYEIQQKKEQEIPVVAKKTPEPENNIHGCRQFTFDASSSYDVNNRKLVFLWDFGDGQTSSEPITKHEYKKGGEYTVKLTVKNDSGLPCDTATTSQIVKVNSAPEAMFNIPEITCVGSNILFDAGKTKDYTSDNLSYYWDFGDSTKYEGKITEKSYNQGGTYTVTLKVDDNENTSCSTDILKKTIYVNTPPVADAGKDINLCLDSFDDQYRVKFDASGSKDADGNNLKYTWNFGDGQTSSEAVTEHIYKKGGEYIATLTVSDNTGSMCSLSKDNMVVTLNKAPVAEAGKDKKVCINLPLKFDGSDSLTEENETLTYIWDTGDGTVKKGKIIEHSYSKGGEYTVKLTVDDNKNTKYSKHSDSLKVLVNSRPKAVIKGPELESLLNEIKFNASKSSDNDNDSLTYVWDFGDSVKVEAGPVVKHKYEKGGEYTVTLTVDDGRDFPCSSDKASMKIRINTPPVADAGPNLACCVNTETFFDASGSYDDDNNALIYTWDFGDGTRALGEKVTHVYTKSGVYKVTLTVDDQSGTENSKSTSGFTATVSSHPVPIMKINKE